MDLFDRFGVDPGKPAPDLFDRFGVDLDTPKPAAAPPPASKPQMDAAPQLATAEAPSNFLADQYSKLPGPMRAIPDRLLQSYVATANDPLKTPITQAPRSLAKGVVDLAGQSLKAGVTTGAVADKFGEGSIDRVRDLMLREIARSEPQEGIDRLTPAVRNLRHYATAHLGGQSRDMVLDVANRLESGEDRHALTQEIQGFAPDVRSPEDSPAFQAGGNLQRWAAETLPRREGYEHSLALDVVEGGTSLLAFMALSAVGGPAASFTYAGVLGMQEGYDRAREHGLDPDRALDKALQSAPGGVIQALPAEMILRRVPGELRGDTALLLRRTAEAFGGEFTVENLGRIWQNVVELSYNPDQEIMEDTPISGFISGSGAAGIQALMLSLGRRGYQIRVADPSSNPIPTWEQIEGDLYEGLKQELERHHVGGTTVADDLQAEGIDLSALTGPVEDVDRGVTHGPTLSDAAPAADQQAAGIGASLVQAPQWGATPGVEQGMTPIQPAPQPAEEAVTPEEIRKAEIAEHARVRAAERVQRLRTPDPASDDLATVIRKLGGINVEIESDWAGRLSQLNEINRAVGLPGIEQRGDKGRSLDDLAVTLHEMGYIPSPDAGTLAGYLSSVESGEPLYSDRANLDRLMGERPDVDPDLARQAEDDGPTIQEISEYAGLMSAEGMAAPRSDEAWTEITAIAADVGVPMTIIEALLESRADDAEVLAQLRQEINEAINGKRARTEDHGRSPEDRGGQAQAAQDQPGAGEAEAAEAESSFLTSYSEADIAAREQAQQAEQQQQAEADRKAQADAEVGGFVLSGSSRPADMAEARGQRGLFDQAASKADAEPSQAQIEAGNYKKGHASVHGLDITIENPRGSVRRGVDAQGREWESRVAHHYGYFKRTEGKDGDHVDVFIGPRAEDPDAPIFVVDQVNPGTRRFDEHKVMMGFASEADARDGYLSNYEEGWQGLGGITRMTLDQLKSWLRGGGTKRPAAKADTPAPKGAPAEFQATHVGPDGKRYMVAGESIYQDKRHPQTGRLLKAIVGKSSIKPIAESKGAAPNKTEQAAPVIPPKIQERLRLLLTTHREIGKGLEAARKVDKQQDAEGRYAGEFMGRKDTAERLQKAQAGIDKALSSIPEANRAPAEQFIQQNRPDLALSPVEQEWVDGMRSGPEQSTQAAPVNDGDANARALAERGGVAEKVARAYLRVQDRGPITTTQAEQVRQHFSGEKGMAALESIAEQHGDSSIADLMNRVMDAAGVVTAEAAKQQGTPSGKVQGGNAKVIPDSIGEALPVAKRNIRKPIKEMADADIASQPLSKIWPQKDIQDLGDKWQRAFATTARDEIPRKPTAKYKKDRWVQQVKALRGLFESVRDGSVTKSEIEAKMESPEYASLRPWYAKVELMSQIDESHWPRVGAVRAYPVASDRAGGPHVLVEIDGKTARFHGATSVNDVIAMVNDRLTAKAPDTQAQKDQKQYEIWVTPGGGAYIARKGNKRQRLREFDSSDSARAFLESNVETLNAAWEAIKAQESVHKADMRRKDNRPRTGKDHRRGTDVTAESFVDTFGFRGAEFGKWVSQGKGAKDRQGMLNAAYDALMDLSDILGIPPRAISLNGELGIGFGSRGAGSASAHFEPDTLVINLTKPKGAGALAHEWFHALDNYFQRKRGKPLNNKVEHHFITYAPENYYQHKNGQRLPEKDYLAMVGGGKGRRGERFYRFNPDEWTKIDGVRPEVADAFAELVDALGSSPMSQRSKLIDKKPEAYWSQIIERGARAFENYVIDKMHKQGYHNDYLANVVPVETFARNPERYPYLLPSEMAPIEQAFDTLFSTIETRTDGAGNVELFSRSQASAPGLSLPDARKAITPITIRQKIKTAIHETAADASAEAGVYVPDDALGFYHGGKMHLIAGNHADTLALEGTLWHETLHAGVAALYQGRDAEYVQAMNDIRLTNKGINRAAREWEQRHGRELRQRLKSRGITGETADRVVRVRATEEALAEMSQAQGRDIKLKGLRKFLAKVVRFMREKGFTKLATALESMTDAEALATIMAAREAVEVGEATMFRMSPSYLRAWHGTPHNVTKFSTDAIGSGEGAQAYGWGLYFAERRDVAEWYQDSVSKRHYLDMLFDGEVNPDLDAALDALYDSLDEDSETRAAIGRQDGYQDIYATAQDEGVDAVTDAIEKHLRGNLYEVDLAPAESEYLLWDKPLSEQSDTVRGAARSLWDQVRNEAVNEAMTGEDVYRGLTEAAQSQEEASMQLLRAGVRGIKYLDGSSRKKGEGAHNYVIFDDSDVSIQARFSRPTPQAQGFFAKGQPLDRAIRTLFAPTERLRDDRGRFLPGVKVANQTEKIIKEAKFRDDGAFAFMNPIIETARAGLIDRYKLTEEFKQREAEAVSEEARILSRAEGFLKTIAEKVSDPAELRVLQGILAEGDVAEADLMNLAAPVRQAIDDLGQEMVALGLLNPESYQKNLGKYLHRSYMKYETHNMQAPKWARNLVTRHRRKIYGDELKARGLKEDVTTARLLSNTAPDWWGRKLTRGEADKQIKGTRWHIYDRLDVAEGTMTAEGIEEGGKRPRVLERVFLPADQPVPAKFQAWTHRGEWEVTGTQGDKLRLRRDFTREERESMGEVLDVRYNILKTFQLMAHDVAYGKFFKDIAANPDWATKTPGNPKLVADALQATRAGTFAGYEWVKVPESGIEGTRAKKWGALAGMYVRPEVWRDLNELDRMQNGTGTWQWLLTQWKLNKALALDTPIPTASGWTTMGEIQVGDTLFDENGKPCTVLEVKEVQYGRPCYRVEFSDGTSIVADDEHWWFTTTPLDRRNGKPGEVRTTKEIRETLTYGERGDSRHSIAVAEPLDLPEADLPIHPYVLGAWLGDGFSNEAQMCAGGRDAEEIIGHLADVGAECFEPRIQKTGVWLFTLKNGEKSRKEIIRPKLRRLGVLNNKHIPQSYLRASKGQRLELLRGLMDTDGWIEKAGSCGFSSSIPELRDGAMELLRSLGFKPTVTEVMGTLRGEETRPSWRIHFKAFSDDEPVFKLRRKKERLHAKKDRRLRTHVRYITGITPVESVPVRCIAVSSDSHLYLAGEAMIATHNTARSPVVHTNNVFSNFVLMDLIDVRMQDLVRGIAEFRNKGELYKEAVEHGAFGGSFAHQELQRNEVAPLLDELMKQAQASRDDADGRIRYLSRMSGAIWRTIKAADRKMIDAYQVEDSLFRMATFMRYRSMGASPQEAGMLAREQFLNYDIRAPWVNAARRTVLPFISYTYRAVPAVATAIAHRPWKLAKYILVGYMLNALAYAITDGDEDEERRTMRDPMQAQTWASVPFTDIGLQRMIRMPWNDKHDNPVFLDIFRWMPVGDVFDTNQGQIGIPAWLQAGGPLMIAAEMMLNRSAFTGRDIVDRQTDTFISAAEKRMDYLWKAWMPSAAYIPGSWHNDKLMSALRDERDIMGRPYSATSALASGVGIKVQPHDVQLGYYFRGSEIDRRRRALIGELRQLQMDEWRNIGTPERRERDRRRIMRQIERLAEEAGRLQGK